LTALLVLAYFVFVHIIEGDVLGPRVVGKAVGVHPVISIVALVAGSILCWARALGEFGATITFAGNLPGTTQTMPLAIYEAFEHDPEAAIALSLVLLLVAVIVLVALRDKWLRGPASL